ncbi:cyclic AMP-dependent transcription factor ATF-1-like [Anopheles bellator]|uniref:cyclic AMP-dependent transcription factor ATF-1-like n=1 Tax=Anopheles bellator TaxID=139047 RepID=UPI00264703A8|nr:cyclic AMP-dependent transcription factor ATF-1-like [Anopheles bellator]
MDIKPESHIGSGSVTINTEANSDDKLPDEETSHTKRSDSLTKQPSHIVGGKDHDQLDKREMRLQINREASRRYRQKKAEYIKLLENRVAELQLQNMALFEVLTEQKSARIAQNTDSSRQ